MEKWPEEQLGAAVPDITGGVRVYKSVRISEPGLPRGTWRVMSHAFAYVYLRGSNRAVCNSSYPATCRVEDVPSRAHTCGFYGYFLPESVFGVDSFCDPDPEVMVACRAEGSMWFHPLGLRAERIRMEALWYDPMRVDFRHALDAARFLGVESFERVQQMVDAYPPEDITALAGKSAAQLREKYLAEHADEIATYVRSIRAVMPTVRLPRRLQAMPQTPWQFLTWGT